MVAPGPGKSNRTSAFRILARRIRSQLLLWVVTGIVAVCIWNGLFTAAAYWEIREHNYTVVYYDNLPISW